MKSCGIGGHGVHQSHVFPWGSGGVGRASRVEQMDLWVESSPATWPLCDDEPRHCKTGSRGSPACCVKIIRDGLSAAAPIVKGTGVITV